MGFEDPKFNDDLLLLDTDRQRAAQAYPTIIHVLDDPELRDAFLQFDVPANRGKKRSRRLGSIAIILGATAIMGASLELGLVSKEHRLGGLVALAASLCGIASLVIGGAGVLFGRSKRQWLHMRFAGERLRQLHFQSLVRLNEIADSLRSDQARAEYIAKRRTSFAEIGRI